MSQLTTNIQGAATATQGLSSASQLLGSDFEQLNPEQQASKWQQYEQSVTQANAAQKTFGKTVPFKPGGS